LTDEEIRLVIKIVADEAWGIAYLNEPGRSVCLRIEDLSDDPVTRDKLIAKIKEKLA
jgi:hypothetical protein